MTESDPTESRAIEADDSQLQATKVLLGGGRWISLDLEAADNEGEQLAAEAAQEELQGRLRSVLAAERLVILAGLGTSLSVKSEDGRSLAPSMADLWTIVSALPDFEDLTRTLRTETSGNDIESLLSRCQFALALEPNPPLEAFVEAAEAEIVRACRFADGAPSLRTHELFLRKVARRSTRLPRTQLFTTNYDLVFERAANNARFHLVDGFGLTEPRRFDGSSFDIDFVRRRVGERPVFEQNVLQLFKLHGSVDWALDRGELIRDSNALRPVLIYPAQSKFQLSYERPYLECMARFQMALREPDVALLVVGFGFHDEHLAAPIRAAVRSNVGLKVVAVSPHIAEATGETPRFLRDLATAGDERIVLVASDFERFTALVPDIALETEREAHEGRIDRAAGIIEA